MASFKTESPLKLHGLANRKLGDDAKKAVMIFAVEDSHRARTGHLSYVLANNLEFEVELFNDGKDRDRAHGIIGKLSRRDRSKRIGWSPLIEPGANGAWLCYTTSARLRQSVSLKTRAPQGFRATEQVRHFYYRRHRRNTLLLTALSADLADQKTAFSLRDVLALTPAQAVGFATAGEVRLSLKLGWGEILASGMTRLAGLLASSGPVAIPASARALAEFTVTVKDGFKLVFVGLPNNRVRVALRKSDSKAGSLGAGAGIRVKFARPSEIDRLLLQVVAGLLGLSPGDLTSAIETLDGSASLEQLSPIEQGLLDSLVENLGLESEFETVADALDLLDDFQGKVRSTLSDIARVRVEMGFAYDYSRLATDASIYEGDFTRAALERLHPDLLAGRFQSILSAAAQVPAGIETRRFLTQKSLVIRNTVGLSLGAGKWMASGKERTGFKFIRQENAGRAVRISLRGSRRYDGAFFGPMESARVEFKADMPDFEQAGKAIGVTAFKFAFAVTYQDDRAWSSLARLRSFLDMGLLFGIAPEGDLEILVEQVRSRFSRKKTQGTLTLRLSHTAVLGFSEWLTRSTARDLAPVIAGAMEYSERRRNLQTINSRRFLYGGFWAEALQRQWDDPYEASRFALGIFRPLDTSLYRAEKQALLRRGRDSVTVFTLIRRNPDLLRDFQVMRRAFDALHQASRANSPCDVLPGIVKNIHGFANTRFKARVMGALVDSYRSSGQAPSRGINMAAMITAVNGDQAMALGRKH